MILAEGYMDVIAINQAGFSNVVATLGTAITPEHARKLSRFAKEVVIAYDSDGPGQQATQKAINRLSEVGIATRILHMTGAKIRTNTSKIRLRAFPAAAGKRW